MRWGGVLGLSNIHQSSNLRVGLDCMGWGHTPEIFYLEGRHPAVLP